MNDFIKIRGARIHNLKNIDLDIPKNKLVVITGLSGSGKSSLAFDTIYAEGQRRYVESLSAYARQFLGVMDKPDVDKIEGLSPAIAIDQKSVSSNPRSTVGTITEIYDYLRLLFARVGKPFCPKCGQPIKKQSATQIVDQIMELPAGSQIAILGPLVRARKGEHRGILEEAQHAGFVRVRIDGTVHRLDEILETTLDKKKKHNIEVVVDRLELPKFSEADFGKTKREKEAAKTKKEKIKRLFKEERIRVADSIETALKLGKGIAIVNIKNKSQIVKNIGKDLLFSEHFACEKCGISLPEIEPRLFSFNNPFGACPECQGLGSKLEIDPSLVIPNPRLTVAEGAIRPWATASHRVGRQGWYWWNLETLAEKHNFSLNEEMQNLPKKIIDLILYGEPGFEGVIPNLQRRWQETESEYTRSEIERYMIIKKCPICQGKRLRPEALAIKIIGFSIDQISAMSIEQSNEFFVKLLKNSSNSSNIKNGLSESDFKVGAPIIKEILNRLRFLLNVGLNYLTIERSANTLSGGEAQRIRLATQIGSGLTGVLYILDEPSVGLHPRDMGRLIQTLRDLRDLGNTVIVVEHDAQTILAADWIIDIGPGAGECGGKVIFQGTPKQVLQSNILTGKYLSGKIKTNEKKPKRINIQDTIQKFLIVKGAKQHNLKNIDVRIPLGHFVCITGVSGSGKSTLISDVLGNALLKKFYNSKTEVGDYEEILGIDKLDKVIIIDQSPIGRTPRSNPATYTSIFTPIRNLFTSTKEAKIRGYKVGRFSFNVKGGRCEVCQGDGYKKVEMYFLPDIYVECEECHGKRYTKEVLEIEYNGKNISNVLNMSVDEAYNFFDSIPILNQKIGTLKEVGLNYIKLGQPANTLSGGEAQRIKLSAELARKSTGKTLYILDEPTTGLHFDDIKRLLIVLHALVARGNTVLVIEHNPQVIKTSDWIIDLGPEGGDKGGYVVAEGTPEQIKKNKKSYTGKYI